LRFTVVKRIIICLAFSFITLLFAQQKQTIRCSVSYVATSVIYFDAGRENNLAAGDTMLVSRNNSTIGKVIITAVSKRSSAAQVVAQTVPIKIGDDGFIEKEIYPTISETKTDTVTSDTVAPVQASVKGKSTAAPLTENIISGRIGLQYSGVSTGNSRFNLSQPSVVFRMDVQHLFGTDMVFTMYSRNYYDLSQNYSRYGGAGRMKNRLYEFLLSYDEPSAAIGYGIGRTTSRYVGGLGTFDGGQFLYHTGNVTTGVILGALVNDLSYDVNRDDNKGALFINYQYNGDVIKHYDGTLAYGQQLAGGKLDREFLYLQNFLSLGSDLSLYESTEIELNDINLGVRKRSFSFSNTYVSVNYSPLPWLSGNVGYDGSRSVYLFESMKSIPDTLFDKHLLQGYRAGATVRLPYFISLSGNLSYRTKKGDARDARTFSGTVRWTDVLGSEIGTSVRYADIIGIYTNGTNVTVDIDRTLFYRLSLALRYDYYSYTLISNRMSFVTHTYTFSGNYRITKMLYSAVNVDRVNDSAMNSYRVFIEAGVRF
jgi:hypothetical protein